MPPEPSDRRATGPFVPALGALVGLVVLAVAAVFVIGAVRADDTTHAPGAIVGEPGTAPHRPSIDPNDPAYDAALSTPREDSNYPDVGDPGVDALHYHLDLAWDGEDRILTGVAEIALRSTTDADHLQLDLDEHLEVGSVELDGQAVEFEHTGKDLVINVDAAEDARHLLRIEYAGTPEPYPAPTTRSDFDGVGFTITDGGDAWTMQEPYGAFTWYPVNDHPSDKAFYDFTITTPAPRVGVANGELVSREEVDGNNVTEFHLDSAASSYLITIAIAEYEMTEETSGSGVPLVYWTSPDHPEHLEAMRYTAQALDFLEGYLGPFPFSSLGSVVVDSESAMETQQMITYGNTAYTLSPDVVVHEIAHQWYGNIVSPSDWRDMWMNEGMAMYLQGVYEAEATGITIDAVMDNWATYEVGFRADAGPPGNYDASRFAESNVYYGPALMWHELRGMLGDDRFWDMVRTWPTVNPMGNPTREEYLAWIQEYTGEDLTAFFDAWLLGEETPPRS
ncbi:M1 family metallopeptidase [Nocardioides sp. AE5]|uniref:M1 family metallopeptidase n=1 Tax=Nocardioides sp. AE5 TaxID=2962573 RepID=UPI0028820777|nr:M1 family metallopeptidase [Nocardioides sp. AE5]MDT0203449.1 M1 family metallopeptidase [Nocardioides sp. AE5]